MILRTHSRLAQALLAAAAVVTVATYSHATGRNLVKFHRDVVLDGQFLAEFTNIATVDELSPYLSKFLYQDQADRRMVILVNTVENGPSTISVKLLSTGETLTIVQNTDDSSTVTLGSAAPVIVLKQDVWEQSSLPQQIKTTGQQALATVSNEFQLALGELCKVGSIHSRTFAFVGAYLNGLFFTEFEGRQPKFERAGAVSGAVKFFDPAVHAPGEFEQGFGNEYYQLP